MREIRQLLKDYLEKESSLKKQRTQQLSRKDLSVLSKNRKINLLPDLGLYLLSKGYSEPFVFQHSGSITLGKDKFLGWMIGGNTASVICSRVENNPLPIIDGVYMFSIYLGKNLSRTQASAIGDQLQTEGIAIVPRIEHKYVANQGRDTVVPLKYLPEKE